ncbi:MAG: methyltransferase domain-containing protein [Ilumatobacteraceae bacterium]
MVIATASDERKQRGAWYTPAALVDTIVDNVVTGSFLAARGGPGGPLRVLDPACGDGRFLTAVAARAATHGVECDLTGIDIDRAAVDAARSAAPDARIERADALRHDFGGGRFDLVIGNPPFLSQMAAATTRGGASGRSGGPYADAAVEFLALAAELVEPDGGRVAFVLPQSVLGARDARPMRASFDERATLVWSWWTGERIFDDAQVLTCALAFQFSPDHSRLRQEVGGPGLRNLVANVEMTGRGVQVGERSGAGNWSFVVTSRRGIPDLPALDSDGEIGNRAMLNANFRDEYYGMIPAVGDHHDGPSLITSGLIDPGRTHWGDRSVTFAKQRFEAPRIDLDLLDAKMQRWAHKRLVPKVLVANQTSIVEAVCDPDGDWLPAVPVIGIYPEPVTGIASTDPAADESAAELVWHIAAVLTSPVASAWVWHHGAGTGLSATSIRVGPALLANVPWPTGDLDDAVTALRLGDVRACAMRVLDAYGLDDAGARDELFSWWSTALERIETRSDDRA